MDSAKSAEVESRLAADQQAEQPQPPAYSITTPGDSSKLVEAPKQTTNAKDTLDPVKDTFRQRFISQFYKECYPGSLRGGGSKRRSSKSTSGSSSGRSKSQSASSPSGSMISIEDMDQEWIEHEIDNMQVKLMEHQVLSMLRNQQGGKLSSNDAYGLLTQYAQFGHIQFLPPYIYLRPGTNSRKLKPLPVDKMLFLADDKNQVLHELFIHDQSKTIAVINRLENNGFLKDHDNRIRFITAACLPHDKARKYTRVYDSSE